MERQADGALVPYRPHNLEAELREAVLAYVQADDACRQHAAEGRERRQRCRALRERVVALMQRYNIGELDLQRFQLGRLRCSVQERLQPQNRQALRRRLIEEFGEAAAARVMDEGRPRAERVTLSRAAERRPRAAAASSASPEA
jgi:hypothetical protein